MGRIAELLDWARARVLGDAPEVTGDPGGEATIYAQHFAPAGDDSRPLPGDFFVTVAGPGTGEEIVIGYHNPNDTPITNPGEKRIYSRNANGEIVAEIHLKDSGVIVLNGVEIDPNGNVTAPGEVTAKAGAASVSLSTHVHNSAMGPTDKPTPGS